MSFAIRPADLETCAWAKAVEKNGAITMVELVDPRIGSGTQVVASEVAEVLDSAIRIRCVTAALLAGKTARGALERATVLGALQEHVSRVGNRQLAGVLRCHPLATAEMPWEDLARIPNICDGYLWDWSDKRGAMKPENVPFTKHDRTHCIVRDFSKHLSGLPPHGQELKDALAGFRNRKR